MGDVGVISDHLFVQVEHVRHEGRWQYVDWRSDTGRRALKAYRGETHFGPGSPPGAAEKAMRAVWAIIRAQPGEQG